MAMLRWAVGIIVVIMAVGLLLWWEIRVTHPSPKSRAVAVVRTATSTVVLVASATATLSPATPSRVPLPSFTSTPVPATTTATSVPTTTAILVVDGSLTPTIYPPGVYPTMTPYLGESDGILSSGLGLKRGQWEQLYTPSGNDGEIETYDSKTVEDGLRLVFYDERVGYIEQNFPSPYLTESRATIEGEKLMPSDAELKEVYTPQGYDGTTVRLYYSPSLAETFAEDLFCNAEPGYFSIRYTSYDGEIDTVTVALGDCLD